ncbi:MAG: two-component sensor histidine kinase, partial [Bacteroidetes bacterium]|nr:two-component sensor histidine kinase [Bacteroidota bacterium]
MILLILMASILIAAVTIYQYKEQTKEYNQGRLDRKEESVKASINYWFSNGNTFPLIPENLPHIFKDKIFEISDIDNLEINIYYLDGNLAISSHSGFVKSVAPAVLSDSIISKVSKNYPHRHVITQVMEGNTFQSSHSYLVDNKFKPIGILNLEYLQDNSRQDRDLEEFLARMGLVYALMFLLAIGLAFFISSYITRNIKAVTDKMQHTRLNKRNEKILLKDASAEIFTLVNAYNAMVDELEESAVKLAKGEREQAWREMAKQVAHEIKNPLTPMRLTVQSFQR